MGYFVRNGNVTQCYEARIPFALPLNKYRIYFRLCFPVRDISLAGGALNALLAIEKPSREVHTRAHTRVYTCDVRMHRPRCKTSLNRYVRTRVALEIVDILNAVDPLRLSFPCSVSKVEPCSRRAHDTERERFMFNFPSSPELTIPGL